MITDQKLILATAWDELDRLNLEHGENVDMEINRRLAGVKATVKGTIAQYWAPTNTIRLATSHYGLDHIVNTIRHEYAHALEARRHGSLGHGRLWKMYARQLGAYPKANAYRDEVERHMARERTRN